MRQRVLRWLIALMVSNACWAGGEQRPLRVHDLFELEAIGHYYGGPVAFSPDGSTVAFTRIRPRKDWVNYKWEYLWGQVGGDIWLESSADTPATRVTDGSVDGAGFWAPQWSPDGERLAMLSTRGGNVTLWVWERQTRVLRQLSTRGLDLGRPHERPFTWIDSERILCGLLPDGERPAAMEVELRTPRLAPSFWMKAPQGSVSTASVLQSGVDIDITTRTPRDLALVDVKRNRIESVFRYHGSPERGRLSTWRISPDRRHVAFSPQSGSVTPSADEPLRLFGRDTHTVAVCDLEGRTLFAADPRTVDVFPESLRWSSDGRRLAFVGLARSQGSYPRIWVLEFPAKRLIDLDLERHGLWLTETLTPPNQAYLEWSSRNRLLFRAAERRDGKPALPSARRDWWVHPLNGKPLPLTRELKNAPEHLWPEIGRHSFVGVSDGEIWRIRADGGRLQNLTKELKEPVGRIAWPAISNSGREEWPVEDQTYSHIIYAVHDELHSRPHLLDLITGTAVRLDVPANDAQVVAFSSASRSVIYSASSRQGTFLWRSTDPFKQSESLMEANRFLRGIAETEYRSIDYTSLDGKRLKAWLLLPIGYEHGRRYPLITWVYPQYVAGVERPATLGHLNALSQQIPAARGYAVLLPSIPLVPRGEADEPLLSLLSNVMPAIDQAISQGYVDADRLLLFGHSYGGYGAYGLVAQSQRFRAAVAAAGFSNLLSLYSIFDARHRYTEFPHEHLFMPALIESGQGRMGVPPWRDIGRYWRNSPISYVERVTTPLMIIQGDMDYVALQQGEEFFMSLHRQGKRATFVRYWGEGHVLESPANISDMWYRVFAWFDEFGDISRDEMGRIVFDQDSAKSRKGAPALKPQDFMRFEGSAASHAR